jgi:hypothetical protein
MDETRRGLRDASSGKTERLGTNAAMLIIAAVDASAAAASFSSQTLRRMKTNNRHITRGEGAGRRANQPMTQTFSP